MNSGLVKYQRDDFLSFAEGSDVAEAMAENFEGDGFSEADLVRVKTPSGGGLHWTIGTEATPVIEGVVVFKCRKGILWKSDETSDDKPVLVSDDLKIARLNIPWEEVPEEMQEVLVNHELTEAEVRSDARFATMKSDDLPRLFWWDGDKKLPYCEFGSSTKQGSTGKRAKEYQLLYVLRKNEGMPMRVQLGPTSIRPVRQFFNQMTDVPHYRAMVKLGLKVEKSASKKDYSVVTLERTGIIDKETGDMIKARYKVPIETAHAKGKLNVVTADAAE